MEYPQVIMPLISLNLLMLIYSSKLLWLFPFSFPGADWQPQQEIQTAEQEWGDTKVVSPTPYIYSTSSAVTHLIYSYTVKAFGKYFMYFGIYLKICYVKYSSSSLTVFVNILNRMPHEKHTGNKIKANPLKQCHILFLVNWYLSCYFICIAVFVAMMFYIIVKIYNQKGTS